MVREFVGDSGLMSGRASREGRDKSWLLGSHQCPNTQKVLASDPDIKFYSFVDDYEPSSDEEDPFQPQDCQSFLAAQSQNSHSKDVQDTDSVISCESETDTPTGDIPLRPEIREHIVEFLNTCLEEDISKQDEQ